jgi:hypothetical protein
MTMPRQIAPIPLRRVRLDGDINGEAPPSLEARIATLAEAQETVLTTPGNAPARQDALAKVRALLAWRRGGDS